MQSTLANYNKIDRPINDSLLTCSDYIFLNLLKDGPLSRANISKLSGISRPTISEVADRLVQMRLIKQTEKKKENRKGRSGLLYDFNPEYGYFAIGNIEKGKFSLRLLDFSMNLLSEQIFQLPVYLTLKSLGEFIAGCTEFSVKDKSKRLVSLAIVIDRPSLLKVKPDDDLSFEDKGVEPTSQLILQNNLEQTLTCRVLIDKKANWLAMAEKRLGAAKATQDFVFVSIGEAIEIVSYVNGSVVKGINSIAGDFTDLVSNNDNSLSKIQQKKASQTNANDIVHFNILSVLSIVSVLLNPNLIIIFGRDTSLASDLTSALREHGLIKTKTVGSTLNEPSIEKAINSILFDFTIDTICNHLQRRHHYLVMRDSSLIKK
jgi:hypothetical protein